MNGKDIWMDIDKVATLAKELFLEQGTFLPSVFVELDNTEVGVLAVSEVEEKDNTPDRARIFFDAGRKYGHQTEKTGQGVTDLHFASLTRTQGKQGLLIAKIGDGRGLKHTTRFYEVLRGGGGAVVDLLKNSTLSHDGMISPLLPAFMLGVVTVRRHLSANEARRMLSALLREYERMLRESGML